VTTSGPDSIHRYFESDQQVSGSYSPVVRTYELNPHPTLGVSSDSNNLKIPYDWCSNHQCTTTATQKTGLWLESTHWPAEHDPNRSSRCISSHVDPMRGTIIRPASSNTAGSAISLAERRTLKPSGTRDVPTQPSPTPPIPATASTTVRSATTASPAAQDEGESAGSAPQPLIAAASSIDSSSVESIDVFDLGA
jgi:hypothetical protein